MDSSYCPIDKLPLEIVHIIFDHLNLKSLKSVSRTCHRWERIFSDYCTKRFMLRIDGAKLHKALIMLERTRRLYRTVYLYVHYKHANCQLMQAICRKLFEPRWQQHLVVLKFDLGRDWELFAGPLSEVVAKLDSLQELQIRYAYRFINPPLFRQLKLINHTMHKLVLDDVLPGVIDCPSLRILEVASTTDVETIVGKQYAQRRYQEPDWLLKQLEELVITNHSLKCDSEQSGGYTENRPGYKVHFYRQLTQLKKLYYHAPVVPERILQAIGESCVQLQDLFIFNLNMVDPNALRYLSNLTNLRQLGILYSSKVIPFASINLPSLERLLLGMVKINWLVLANVKSIKWLKIQPETARVRQMCDALAEHLSQLHFLWIVLPLEWDSPSSGEICAMLSKMPALKTLVLENVTPLEIMTLIPSLPRLSRLVIFRDDDKIEYNMAELAQLVPNVARIEIGPHKPSQKPPEFDLHTPTDADGFAENYHDDHPYVQALILRKNSYRSIRALR